jgi:hypothetical protein
MFQLQKPFFIFRNVFILIATHPGSKGYNVTILDLETDNLSSLCEEYDSLLSMACDVRDFSTKVSSCFPSGVPPPVTSIPVMMRSSVMARWFLYHYL